MTAVECGFLDALTLLTAVVVEQTEGVATKEDDGNEVAGREEGHKEIDDVPDEFETGNSSKDDHHASRTNAINGHYRRIRCDKTDIRLTVIVVADDAGEGEEEDGNGHKNRPCGTNLRLQCRLREGNAIQLRHAV